MKRVHLRLIIIAGLLSLACTTKVSEWVLLNALPNEYTLVYFHKDPLSEIEKQQNAEVENSVRPANIQFRNFLSEDTNQPYYGLYYGQVLISRYHELKELKNLISSPVREKIARELMAGKLCVMLYLKTGIKEKDDAGIRIVKRAIASSPFSHIIPVVELSRNDIEEKHFSSMLLSVETDLKDISEPMLFGIFGRFKALEPLLGRGISEENVNLMVDFLTADCSCLIKDDLPGMDILFTNHWESPTPALVNPILDANPSLMHR